MDVHAALSAYAAAATGGAAVVARTPEQLGAAAAIASHFLAVTSSRSLALVGGDDAVHSLVAHRTWFSPSDIRCTSGSVAAAVGGRVVPLGEALAADIVNIHVPMALAASQLRRGTHVNALAPVELDNELRALAKITDEATGLPALAAGLVDGRQLDELTVFVAAAASTR
jgi:hypothetical protein